jgi:hypothetical protein
MTDSHLHADSPEEPQPPTTAEYHEDKHSGERDFMIDTSLKNLHILGFIPARGNSKGVRSKNKRLLNGLPLVGYTIRSALQSTLLSRVIVSTEDGEIARIAKDLGAEVPYLRPKWLSTDNANLQDVLLDVIRHYEERENWRVDMVVTMLPTTPFRTPSAIDDLILFFLRETSSQGAILCIQTGKLRTHPKRCLVFPAGGDRLAPLLEGNPGERTPSGQPRLYRNLMSISSQWVRYPRSIVDRYRDKGFIWAQLGRVLPDGFDPLFNLQSSLCTVGLIPPPSTEPASDVISIDIDEPLDFLKARAIIEYGISGS